MNSNEAMEHITTEQLLDYADGRLAPQEHRRVEQHLADCAACRAELASLLQTMSKLAEDDWVMPPARVRASVQRSFRQQAVEGQSRPSFLAWLGALWAPRRRSAIALALLLVILAAGLVYRLLQTPPPTQTVAASAVSGPADVQRAGSNEWQPLEGGAALSEGDLLRTGSGGSVLMSFTDGSTTQVKAEGLLAIRELQSDPRAVALEQRRGETHSRVLPPAAPDALFEIGTPSALITTQAAEFDVIVDEGEATRVTVDSGEVLVIAEGASLALTAGQEASVKPGQPPQLLGEEPTATPTPTATEPTPTMTSTATATPSATPTASSTPTVAPPAPTATPTMEPTEPPPPPPTDEPEDTPEPTEEADDDTPEPTEEPDEEDDTPEPPEEPDEDTPTPTEEVDD